MTDPTDRTIRELRDLAESAANSVRPFDAEFLREHERALAAEAEADLQRQIEAHRQASITPQGVDWARIERLARAVSARQRRR